MCVLGTLYQKSTLIDNAALADNATLAYMNKTYSKDIYYSVALYKFHMKNITVGKANTIYAFLNKISLSLAKDLHNCF